MVASADGRYLFVATVGGLTLLDPSKKKILHTHEDERLDMHTLNCSIIGVETYVLTGIDELGKDFHSAMVFLLCLKLIESTQAALVCNCGNDFHLVVMRQ